MLQGQRQLGNSIDPSFAARRRFAPDSMARLNASGLPIWSRPNGSRPGLLTLKRPVWPIRTGHRLHGTANAAAITPSPCFGQPVRAGSSR
jgi:hypothetical protein